MEHIINQSIVFSPAERTLSILNEGDLSLTLSNPSTRLLLELIKNNKNTVTRAYLMKHVWEDHGFNGSNNNLNGCISELRKAFESLGTDSKMIITPPKVGFILDADVEPYTLPSNTDIKAPIQPDRRIKNDITFQKTPITPLNKYLFPLGATLIVSVGGIIFICFLMFTPPYEFKNIDTRYLYKYGQCNVFTTDPPEIYNRSELIEQADKLLKREAIDCQKPIGDIFYSRMVNRYAAMQVTFIAICFPSQQGDYTYCQTIKNIDGIAP